MKIDYISDTHIDFWVDLDLPEYAQQAKISQFVSEILPDELGEILIVAGDIGHENEQNIMLLSELAKHYKWVLPTFGNHDYYLLGQIQKMKYNLDSFARIQEMKELCESLPNVRLLDGDVFEYGGKKIIGIPMWYDDVYAKEVCFRAPIFIKQLWKQYMMDSNSIYSGDVTYPRLDWIAYSESQKKILDSKIDECDIIFTHVSPDWSNLKSYYQDDPTSTFFHFDGREILKRCNGKTWVFGHTHELYDYFTWSGCHMLCNPLGYPGEHRNGMTTRIRGFQV